MHCGEAGKRAVDVLVELRGELMTDCQRPSGSGFYQPPNQVSVKFRAFLQKKLEKNSGLR
jgi:hypothetical protein